MADRIKGITVEIGGDTTGLSKALSGVNREISSTQKELRDVERLLKLDPDVYKRQQQRRTTHLCVKVIPVYLIILKYVLR